MGKRIPFTTTIDEEFREEAQKKGLCISDILNEALIERLSVISAEQFKEVNRRLEANIELRNKLQAFIEKKGLSDEWLKEQGAD